MLLNYGRKIKWVCIYYFFTNHPFRISSLHCQKHSWLKFINKSKFPVTPVLSKALLTHLKVLKPLPLQAQPSILKEQLLTLSIRWSTKRNQKVLPPKSLLVKLPFTCIRTSTAVHSRRELHSPSRPLRLPPFP